eukprot:6937571-Pyramimonas_sp.AAC.2
MPSDNYHCNSCTLLELRGRKVGRSSVWVSSWNRPGLSSAVLEAPWSVSTHSWAAICRLVSLLGRLGTIAAGCWSVSERLEAA